MYTAARTCYSDGTPSKIHKDIFCSDKKKKALVDAVIAMGHHSVLEHVSMTFSIEGISRACSHQLVRHRIGVSFSQQSQRYIKFGRNLPYVIPESISMDEYGLKKDFIEHMDRVMDFYEYLIEQGVPNEDARFVLPNACCTNLVMTVNARELIEMCKIRMCATAQWEIQSMFHMIATMVAKNKNLSFLYGYLKPKCDWVGFCPEGKRSCGRHKPKEVK